MADIKVSFSSLEALSGDIGNQVKAIEGHLDTLEGQISNLADLWQGSASTGFQSAKQTWFTSANDLRSVLKKIELAVIQSTNGYRDTEDRSTKRWDL